MVYDGQHRLYGQTSTVTVTDSAGDSCVNPEATTYPDITSLTATKSGNSVTFAITCSGVFGYGSISPDTDQNPLTGNGFPELQLCLIEIPKDGVFAQSSDTTVPPPEPPPPSEFSLLGEDYVIWFFNDGTASLNRWEMIGTPPGSVFLVPVYVADLSLVGGDDGNMDFLADMAVDLEGSDRIPNMGHGTLTVVADTTPPVVLSESPIDGQSFGISTTISKIVVARDPESGIDTVRAEIDKGTQDSRTITLERDPNNPERFLGSLPTRRLKLGLHPLEITATNGVGLTGTVSQSFRVKADISDIIALVNALLPDSPRKTKVLDWLRQAQEFFETGRLELARQYLKEARGELARRARIFARIPTPLF